MTPEELKRIREKLGLTQEALAEALGVHRVTLAKWEAGTHNVPEPVARLVERLRDDVKKRRK
jgi:repressor LexA